MVDDCFHNREWSFENKTRVSGHIVLLKNAVTGQLWLLEGKTLKFTLQRQPLIGGAIYPQNPKWKEESSSAIFKS